MLPRTRLRFTTIAAPLAVSVIIPALNDERFLPGLLADLLERMIELSMYTEEHLK